MKIVVLAKQVPDTRAVGKDAMKEDGTVNRAALPAIFNPEDLNALEQALCLKEMVKGSTVTILTMGPPRATEVIRESMFRGADGGVLITDRKFAGADTLATSYTLAAAIRKMGADIVVAGRQAIDGDTAQVGPQVAEKLGLQQVTYCEKVEKCDGETIVIKRRLESGVETVECPIPMVMTVNASAPDCRPQNAKRVLKFKHAKTVGELDDSSQEYFAALSTERPYLNITQWGVADVDVDENQLGLKGSPTKVKTIQNIVFTAKEAKHITSDDVEIEGMIKDLIDSHTIA